ncbi:MAG: TIGR03435 family protein [Bryobacteraceae bacterium]|jgi:uncharacterized protein (TIGR03435 family)
MSWRDLSLLAGALSIVPAWGQQQAAATPSFEVASVKTAAPGSRPYPRLDLDPGRLSARAASLRYLITEAYGVEDYCVVGTSGWVDSDLYTITASSAQPADHAQMMAMLRSLLAERFHLRMQQEDRQMPVFALTVAKGGSKLQPLREGESGVPPAAMSSFPERVTLLVATTIPDLVKHLNTRTGAASLGRPVVDQTDLRGKYKIWLTFDNEMDPEGRGGRFDIDYPSALSQQLGLRLEPKRLSIQVWVVDQAEKPADR